MVYLITKRVFFLIKGNPNTISQQKIYVCVPKYPKKSTTSTKIKGIIGIVNGVLFRPATAGFGTRKLQGDIVVIGTKIGVWIFLVLRAGWGLI